MDDLIRGINRLKNDEILTRAAKGKLPHPYKQNTKRDFSPPFLHFFVVCSIAERYQIHLDSIHLIGRQILPLG